MTSALTHASTSHAARTRTVGAGLALLSALSLTSCFVYDAGRGGAYAYNESDVPVIVSITGTDVSITVAIRRCSSARIKPASATASS